MELAEFDVSAPEQEPLDRERFAEVVREHQTAVLAYCARHLSDPALVRDVAQEVFVTLWRQRDRYQERGKLRAYLLTIARNRCLATGKRRSAHLRLVESIAAEPTPDAADPTEALQRQANRRRLEDALTRLRPDRAEVIRLRHVDELTPTEIAEVLGLPVGTVKSRLHRGLDDLREEMRRGR